MKNTFLLGALIALSAWQGCAQEQARQAAITGRPGSPKCTIEVEVDVVADVEIRGTMGRLHTLNGSPAIWRRFECNVAMPANPGNFRFSGVDGRGRQTLIGDPSSNGTAVVRIEDPKSGREGYTFDLEWGGDGGRQGGGFPGGGSGPGVGSGPGPGAGGGFPGGPGFPQGPPPGGPGGPGRFEADDAVRACSDAAQDQLRRTGYRETRILEARMDGDGRRGDWIYGKVGGRRGPNPEAFGFACSVDFQNRRIGPVSLRPANDGFFGGDSDRDRFSNQRAIHECQDAMQDRLRHDGYQDFDVRRINVDDRPGNKDWIVGDVVARRGPDRDRFDFSCSVDFDGGRIRSINVNRRWR